MTAINRPSPPVFLRFLQKNRTARAFRYKLRAWRSAHCVKSSREAACSSNSAQDDQAHVVLLRLGSDMLANRIDDRLAGRFHVTAMIQD